MTVTHINGLRIILDENMVEVDKTRPKFPDSKNRSRRIEKKLLKRHGGKYHMRPRRDALVSATAGFVVMHPDMLPELERAIDAKGKA